LRKSDMYEPLVYFVPDRVPVGYHAQS